MLIVEEVEIILVKCNLVDNQCQQKSEVLHIFICNKSYVYLLNVEPWNLAFKESCNNKFNKIIITFTNKNGRPLEIEDKFVFDY